MKPLKLMRSEKDHPFKTRRVKRILKKLVPIVLVLAIFTALAIFLTSLSGSSVVNFILSGSNLKSSGSKVNVLLLGIAGGTHDGANLTDTIMVASYNLKTHQVYLISIPRDLWLPSLRAKANAVYEIGLSQNGGLGLTKTVVGNILGIPIHYGLRVDFRGFIKAVDTLGGIDIEVSKAFDDYNYPIEGRENDLCGYEEKEIVFGEEEANKLNITPGKRKVFVSPEGKIATDSAEEDKGTKYFACRFEHISFYQGLIHMDGEEALKFVRSRHGTNGQSSDFSRSKRQQQVLEAVRSKMLSFETLTSPQKISDLIKIFGKSIDTDISAQDALEFYKLSKKLDQTYSLVINDSPRQGLPNGRIALLVHPLPQDYGGAYVLISQDDDFSIIQGYVRKVLTGEIREDEQSSDPGKEEATASSRTGN